MGRVLLCETKKAEEPYTFVNTRVEVYSYEEFCYYIYNNQILVTMDIIDNSLMEWFEKQLELPKLAEELREMCEKETPLEEYLVRILMHKEYYNVDEIREFIAQYEAHKLLRPYEREKQIADGYLRYRRYSKAVSLYKQLLEKSEDVSEPNFLGNVYHNMAVALANNLQLDESRYAFLKAFTLNENEASLRACFVVMASYEDENTVRMEMRKYHLPESYYRTIIDEVASAKKDMEAMQLFHRMQKAVYNKDHGDYKSYSKRMEHVLQDMKETYREQTI